MPWGVAAVAGIGAASSAYGADKASKASSRASKEATKLEREQYEQGLKEVAPFKQVGINALPALESATLEPASPFSFRNPSTYLNDYFASPEYATLNAQATDQILRNRSATGGLRSGGASADLAQIAPTLGINALNRINQQDLQEYGVNQGAANDRFNRLFGVAGMGANVATGNQTAGANFASQAGANAISAGQAKAASYIAQGNAINNLAGDAGSLLLGNKLGYFDGSKV
jgi:hypothetical protein